MREKLTARMRKIIAACGLLAFLAQGAGAQSYKFDQYDHCNPSVDISNGALTVSHGAIVTIVALDITNGKAWFWKSNFTSTSWGGSSGINGNPYTNTNGLAWTPLSGPLYAQVSVESTSSTATLLASSAALYRFAVSGFSSLDAATSATNALQTNSGTVTYTDSNMTATGNTSGRARSNNGVSSGKTVFGFKHGNISGYQTVGFAQAGTSSSATEVVHARDGTTGTVVVKGTNTTSYGNWNTTTFHQGCGLGHNFPVAKVFFEVKLAGYSGNGTHPRIGWALGGAMQVATPVGQTVTAVGWDPINGNLYYNNVVQSLVPGTMATSKTALVAVDMTASPVRVWFGNPDNASFWNGSPTGDPVTGTDSFQLGTTSYQATFSTYAPGDSWQFNFGQSAGVNTTQIAALKAAGWQWVDPAPAGGSRGWIFGAASPATPCKQPGACARPALH